jgi:hypothetical protein
VPVNAIVEVTTQILSTDAPRDYCVNHLSFQTGASTASDTDFQNLCVAIKGVWFATTGSFMHWGDRGGKVVAYNRADGLPRPERGFIAYVPGSWATTSPGPRQISLCTSFYSLRNIKRYRGRCYLPPTAQYTYTDRPNALNLTYALALFTQIDTAVGALTPSWDQAVWSTVDNTNRVVTNWWCNDTWDVQRRRQPKETTRQHNP